MTSKAYALRKKFLLILFFSKKRINAPRVHDAAPFGIYMEHIGIGSVLGLEG